MSSKVTMECVLLDDERKLSDQTDVRPSFESADSAGRFECEEEELAKVAETRPSKSCSRRLRTFLTSEASSSFLAAPGNFLARVLICCTCFTEGESFAADDRYTDCCENDSSLSIVSTECSTVVAAAYLLWPLLKAESPVPSARCTTSSRHSFLFFPPQICSPQKYMMLKKVSLYCTLLLTKVR